MAKVTSITLEADELKTFKELTVRHGTTMALEIRKFVKEYIKTHGDNDQVSLDTPPDTLAYPTAWGTLGREQLKPYSVDEEDEMLERLEKTKAAIQIDRQNKRDAEVEAKFQRTKGKN